QEIEVRNGGNEPLVVTPSVAGSSEIVLSSGEPFEVDPLTSAPILLTYGPVDATTDTAVLTIESNDPRQPAVAVGLTGMGRVQGTRTDVFEMGPRTTDIVLVVDDSESMDVEQAKLVYRVDAFVDSLDAAMVDFRIGVVST